MAEIDLGNVMGPQGKDGSQWYQGTGITGTDNMGTVFPDSEVDDARINDKYINESTGNFYTCTVGGNASIAKWAYSGSLKGPTGATGPAGATGQIDDDTPIEFEESSTESDIVSGESISTIFGKLLKSVKTFRASIGTLSSLKTTVKDSLVNAINELKTGLGTVGELDTTAKDSVVNAINELNENKADSEEISSEINNLTQSIGQKLNISDIANNLTTTASGKALDARQGKALNDALNTHKSSGDHDSRYLIKTGYDDVNGPMGVHGLLHAYNGISTTTISASGNISMESSTQSGINWSSAAKIYSPSAQNLFIAASDEGKFYLHLGVHDNTWALDPDVNGMLGLGTANHKWNSIYATTGSINTSDRNMKNSIQKLDERYIQMFMKLLPVSFKFNDGTSGRTHIGFIAQDVEAAMQEAGLTDIEFAGFCKDQKTIPVEKTQEVESINPETGELEYKTVIYTENKPVDGEYIYSLRYEEFIALNTLMIQKLMERVDALETKYHD